MQATCLCFKMGWIGKMWFSSKKDLITDYEFDHQNNRQEKINGKTQSFLIIENCDFV